MKIFRKLHLLLFKIKQKILGSPIDKLRKSGCEIGTNTHIFSSYIDPLFPYLITIGDNTTVTDVKILAHDASTKKELGYSKIGKVTIGNNCFVGAKSLILPGVTIGDRVIIGAGSVVTKDIPSNSVAVGNPCRVIKSYDEYMQSQRALMTAERILPPRKGLTKSEIAALKEKLNGIWFTD